MVRVKRCLFEIRSFLRKSVLKNYWERVGMGLLEFKRLLG